LSQNQFSTEKQLLRHCHRSIIRSAGQKESFQLFQLPKEGISVVLSQNSSVSEQGCRTRGQYKEMQDSAWQTFCVTKAGECAPACLTSHFGTGASKYVHIFRTNEKRKNSLFY